MRKSYKYIALLGRTSGWAARHIKRWVSKHLPDSLRPDSTIPRIKATHGSTLKTEYSWLGDEWFTRASNKTGQLHGEHYRGSTN